MGAGVGANQPPVSRASSPIPALHLGASVRVLHKMGISCGEVDNIWPCAPAVALYLGLGRGLTPGWPLCYNVPAGPMDEGYLETGKVDGLPHHARCPQGRSPSPTPCPAPRYRSFRESNCSPGFCFVADIAPASPDREAEPAPGGRGQGEGEIWPNPRPCAPAITWPSRRGRGFRPSLGNNQGIIRPPEPAGAPILWYNRMLLWARMPNEQ